LTLLLYCPCLCCVCFFFQLKWIYSGFSSVVQKEIQLPRDPINRFNTTTSLCLSKLRPGFPVTRVVVFLVFSVRLAKLLIVENYCDFREIENTFS
jgi:hypothetical protein